MTSFPAWAGAVIAALIAAAFGLLGVVMKNRWDARAAANSEQRAASTEQAQWVRERRERVYIEFLNATRNYVRTLPNNPHPVSLIRETTNVGVIWEDDDSPQRAAWQDLADAVFPIQAYGSTDVREASTHLLRLLAELRELLNDELQAIWDWDTTQNQVPDEDLRWAAHLARNNRIEELREIPVQRRLVTEPIRKELGVYD